MTSKFKIQYYHRMPQATSPYLQLLEAKKKIFGYKYELIRSDKANYNYSQGHNKSIGHAPSHKHSKTQSHEKQKPKKNNSRKKRSHTEHAEERLHQSLFLNRDVEQLKESKHQATKSLFTVEGGLDQSVNPHDFMRNYKNMVGQEDARNIKSLTEQVESKQFPREKPSQVPGPSLDKLQITEIDDLINLIDTCVEQANDYIGYLTQKIETLKLQNNALHGQQLKILQLKDGIINEKQRDLDRLRKQLHNHRPQPDKTFEIKKLLQIIDKVTEQNTTMKMRLREFQYLPEARAQHREYSEKEKKDLYNQIHNKIDVLNISVDKKSPQLDGGGEAEGNVGAAGGREGRKSKNSKNRFYR